MLQSVLRFPPMNLVHVGDIYCEYLQNFGIEAYQFLQAQFDFESSTFGFNDDSIINN
jgi:hypothetical protein